MNIKYHLYDFHGLNIQIFNSLSYYNKNDILNKISAIISIIFSPSLFCLYLPGIFLLYIVFLKLSDKSSQDLYQNFCKFWEYFSSISVSYGLMSIIVVLIKNLASFPRPDGSSTDSFPSGHSSLVMILYMTLIRGLIYKNINHKVNIIIWNFVSVIIVLIVGLSRIITQNHYPSDVLYGYLIAIIVSIISVYIIKYFRKILTIIGCVLFNFFL